MNKNLHRLIFNHARGLRMAVQETASSCGKANGATALSGQAGPVAPSPTTGLTSLVAALLVGLAGSLQFVSIAHAQIVADPSAPGNQRPAVAAAPNGVPLVNIQTPSAAGVSRNTYTQFDVNAQGVILNNARTNAQTQLGGWVQANPWLAGGAARVILNEVNSSSPSHLRGFVEVGGSRAEVVIANPAGVNVNGGGFINASRATITTGTPVINGGNLEGYVVQKGLVSISGAGLDSSQTDFTGIIARAVEVNAGIWAKELKVTTGANQVDATQSAATPIAGSGAAPAFALDVSALGGMYAGKITLVGTEAGVGVRNAGTIGASAGDVVVQANGWLTNSGNIQASGHTQITATGAVTNNATIYASGNTAITAQGDIINTGVLAAQGDTSVRATGLGAQVVSSAGSVLAAGLNADGSINATGDLTVAAQGVTALQGQTTAGGNASISASQINLADSKVQAQNLNLVAATGDIDASRARIAASGALVANTNQTLRTDGAQVSANQINLTAQNVSNRAGQIVQTGTGSAGITAAAALDNTDGKITSNGSLTLSAADLANTRGQISAVQNADLTATTSLNNTGGKIAAGQRLKVASGTVNNVSAGSMEGDIVSVTASQDFTNSGQLIAGGQLDVTTAGTLNNTGKIAGQQTTVQAATLNNQTSGRIEGNTLAVTADTVNNTAGIVGDTVTVTAATLNNQGISALIAGTSQVDLYVRDALNNTGGAVVYSLGDLNIAANSVRDASDTLLNRTGLVNNNTSVLQADGNMQIAAQTLINTRAAPQLTSTTNSTTQTLAKRGDYWMCEYGNYVDGFAGFCAAGYADLSWYNPAIHINPLGEKASIWVEGHSVETERVTTTTVTDEQLQGALQSEPKVLVGNNLILRNVGSLRNEYGSIMAGGDVTVGNVDPLGNYQTDSVTNVGAVLNRTTVTDEYSVFRWNRNYGSATTISIAPQASTAVIGRVGGTISAGGRVSITAGSVVNTNALPGQSGVGGAASPGPAGAAFVLPTVSSLSSAAGVTLGPLGSLVIPVPRNPGQRYLIESDPRFTDFRQWLSSDYMLNALNMDPATLQKRLGDGFYEQKLIREQVAELTGRRFLQGYQSEEAQYQALMTSGVTVAQQWNLRPGIALTAAQVSQLTSDMVWLVEQEVTLTDGSKVKALVPVVYLSQVHTADLRPTGALISGQSIDIAAKGDLTNNGALQAQNSILLAANKVTNELGVIDASQGSTKIISDTDIVNRSGMISGNSVQLDAGRDILIDTALRQFSINRQTAAGQSTGSNSELGPQGAVVSRGDLSMNAGRDIKLAGAFVVAQGNASLNAGAELVVDTVQTRQATLDTGNSGVRQTQGVTHLGSTLQTGGNLSLSSGGDTTLKAAQVYAGQNLSVVSGGDLTITAAKDTAQLDENLRAKNYVRIDHIADERVVGSSLTAGGNVTLAALQAVPGGGKGNITIEGSSVNAVGGSLNVVADGSVSVVETREQHEYDLFNQTSKKGFLSSKSSSEHNTGASNLAVGSSLSGKEVNVVAGKDITVRGSSVISDDQTRLIAANNVTIEAASNTSQESQFKEQKKSGLFSSGGLSVTLGKQQQSTDTQNTQTTATASTVGSIGGNVVINAGEAYKQVGSDVLTPAGDISITAKKVDIVEAREASRTTTEQKFKQSGLTAAITAPVISAIQTAKQMSQAASQTSDGRMQGLAAATTALATKNAYDAVAADPAAAGGINLSLSLGGSKSQSNTASSSNTAQGSTLAAGGSVNIIAADDGKESNILIQGSTVKADRNITLTADNQVNFLAAQNIGGQNSTNSSSSSSVGVSVGTSGLSVTASASKGRGNSDGSDVSWVNTQVVAGNTLTIQSGGDTNVKGATVAGKAVIADVGGNLNIESLQDVSIYDAKERSAGGSISIPIGVGSFGIGVNMGKTDISSTFNSVTQQSGIKAGDGGFDIVVMGNTDLKGAVIASTDKAVQDNKNSLVTGSFTASVIENKAEYSGQSANIGVSYSGEQKDASGNSVLGKDGKPVQSGYNGFNATLPVALNANGSASSTTFSGVSTGNVIIIDEQAQKEKTAQDAATTVASINRDVSTDRNTTNALNPIFNEQEIKAGFAITQALMQETGTFLVNRAKEADAKVNEAKDKDRQADDKAAQAQTMPEGEHRTQLLQEASDLKAQATFARGEAADLESKWGSGGTYRQVMTATAAAAAGNVSAGGSQFVQSAVVNLVQSKAAEGIKQLADDLGIAEGSVAHAALHAINACLGAAAQGSSCGAAALGAASATVVSNLLEGTAETLTNEQKEARKNLVAALVTGVAAANGQAAAANTAALIEMENNSNIKNAVKVAISDANNYISKKGKESLEKVAELLEKIEVKPLVDKQKDIAKFLDDAAARGGLSEGEIAVLGAIYAANQALFPTSALDLIPGAGKAIGKTGDLIKIGMRAEDAVKIAVADAKAAGQVGDYGKVGGHHVHAKSGFKDALEYDLRKGFSVSNEFMDANSLNHRAMTSKQRELFKELELSGKPNTMQEHTRIAIEALQAGGASFEMARTLVAESLRNLKNQGARLPSNLPWSGK